MGSLLSSFLLESGIPLKKVKKLGIEKYQPSGKVDELYELAGISAKAIASECRKIMKSK